MDIIFNIIFCLSISLSCALFLFIYLFIAANFFLWFLIFFCFGGDFYVFLILTFYNCHDCSYSEVGKLFLNLFLVFNCFFYCNCDFLTVITDILIQRGEQDGNSSR